jgi:hypothetical protein
MKATPVSLCPPQIPRYPTWDRNSAAMVGIRASKQVSYGMALNNFDGSSKFLLAFANTVNLGFGSHRGPWLSMFLFFPRVLILLKLGRLCDERSVWLLLILNPLTVSFKFKKVKLSLYRPWRLLELREVEAHKFSDIRHIDGGKVVSPTRRPLFTPRKIPGTHFC